MYNGQIKRKNVKRKKTIDWKSLLLWYTGIIISFLPIIVDMCVYLAKHHTFAQKYWINLCLKGDLLWILATIIVLTILDCIGANAEKKGFRLVCIIIGIILWGISFVIWCVFKYIYPENYNGEVPVIITLVIGGLTLLFCSPLQIRKVEGK